MNFIFIHKNCYYYSNNIILFILFNVLFTAKMSFLTFHIMIQINLIILYLIILYLIIL